MSQNPHSSSILGAVAFALGLEPQQGLERALRLGGASGISRILDGARPTPISMLRDLEIAVDLLTVPPREHRTYGDPCGVPFLSLARFKMADSVDDFEEFADEYWQPHDAGRFERMGEIANAMGIASLSDARSLFAGCCRAVFWSPSDVASHLYMTPTLARSLISGEEKPGNRDWRRLHHEFDRLTRYGNVPHTAVEVAARWIDNPAKRAQLEWEYAQGDAPLFCE